VALRLGVIAEDQSDIDVIAEIVAKLTKRRLALKTFRGHGCGKILNKCGGWARVLREQGCTRLIVVHDLDTAHLPELRARLTDALAQCPISQRVIVIPIREIEAWLLADEVAIGKISKRKQPKPIANPERYMRPKEVLRDLLYRLSDKRIEYVNTVHNRQIASHASVARLRRCASFHDLEQFVAANLR